MESPVSVVVAEIVMQHVEERALASYATLATLLPPFTKTKLTLFTADCGVWKMQSVENEECKQ